MTTKVKAIHIEKPAEGKFIEIQLTGKLNVEDYEAFIPEIERLIKQEGKLRILLELNDFHGWTAGALWKDTKFALKHFSDIERIAIVGDSKWEHGMAVFCKPFTTADVRYFDTSRLSDAREWIRL